MFVVMLGSSSLLLLLLLLLWREHVYTDVDIALRKSVTETDEPAKEC